MQLIFFCFDVLFISFANFIYPKSYKFGMCLYYNNTSECQRVFKNVHKTPDLEVTKLCIIRRMDFDIHSVEYRTAMQIYG